MPRTFVSAAGGYRAQDRILRKHPYPNDTFGVVIANEALAQSADLKNSVQELARVVERGGSILIIDKDHGGMDRYE